MSEWINSKDLLPPIGQSILVFKNKKMTICKMNLCMIEIGSDFPTTKTLEEMQDIGFLWTSLPEIPK